MHRAGVAATSVDDVLRAAGAGKSQFYHYFSSKDDLIAAVLEHQLERVLTQQRSFDVDTFAGLRDWFEAMLADHERRDFSGGCPLGAIAGEVAHRDGRLRSFAADAFARWGDELARGLEDLKQRGGLQADTDVAALAEEMIATIQGGYLISAIKREGRPMRNALHAALDRLGADRE